MSRALLALTAVTLMELVSVAAFADQRDSYDRRGYLNISRVMVRQKICPTGTCPPGTYDWRWAQIHRCMRHYANVRVRKVGEK